MDESVPRTKLHNTKSLLRETKKANKQLKQENKRLKKMLESNEKSKDSNFEKENGDLRALLKETKAVNKRLKKQNKRQKQVWFALQQMCKALDGISIERHENKSNQTSAQTKKEDDFNIHLISMSSILKRYPSGDKYNVSVKYTAKGKPGVQWTIMTNSVNTGSGGRYATRGWTEYTKTNKTYVSGIELNHDLLLSYYISVRIYDTPNFVDLIVNMSEILESQTNKIEQLPLIVQEKSRPIIAHANENMTIWFHVKGNLSVYSLVEAEAYMNGLDYSVHPPKMFEISSFSDDINVEIHRLSNSSANVSITVQQHLSENGGILSLSISRNFASPRLYDRIQYGRSFDVLSNITKSVVRPGTIGLFSLENTSVVYPPLESIICGAMAYELPDVVLVRETDKNVTEMPYDVFLEPDKHTVIKTFTIYANDTEAAGNYTCMASIKNNIITSKTEVIKFEPPVINDTGTGVMTNNSEQVKIGCEATGKPTPGLELRLYDEYGPDLSKDPRFKVVRSSPDSWTAVLMVTIGPVVKDIYRVYCVAVALGGIEYKKIEIFPEPESGPNWELRYDIMDNIALNNP